jgi:hypothetical protein
MKPVRIVRPPSRFLLALSLAAVCWASLSCNSGTATPPPFPTPTPTGTSLAGTVTDVVSGVTISGVVLTIQGMSATTGSDGRYSITGLTAGQASLTAKHQGHVNFSQNVTLSGTTTVNVPLTPSNAAKAAGNWTGNWRDTTFGTTGTMTMNFSVDTIAQTIQGTLNVNGNVLGIGPPPPITISGPYVTHHCDDRIWQRDAQHLPHRSN